MQRKFPRNGSITTRAAGVLALSALLTAAFIGWNGQRDNVPMLSLGSSVVSAAEPASSATLDQANALSRAFRKASNVAMPSVVTIRSKTKAKVVRGERNLPQENPFKGTPFEDFFGDNGHGMRNFQMPNPGPREGMGSGVIIDKSGLVLTNNHVVAGADEVEVHLADGRTYKGFDIKTDDQTDLAVVHIKANEDLPAAKLGNSDELEIGDWVIAIGNPFELEQTVSAGIISGKGRELGSIRRAKFLQTDAAINPGNSGGPLVNLNGEIVGINTAIATNTGSFNGIGFAIPINLAKWVVPQLVKTGKVERAYLGVSIGEVTPELAQQFGVEANSGVLVSEVFPNSPAAEAGFKAGDVIRKFSGKVVHNPRELQELVERTTLGSKSNVEVWRDGKSVTVEVVSKALPKDFGTVASRGNSDQSESEPEVVENSAFGMDVTDLTSEQAEQLGYKGETGALVAEVEPNGVAYAHGIRPGMLVLKVGKKTVKNADDFKKAIGKESAKDGVLLLVRTQAGNRFVVLQQE
jgi:serine protease Do